MTVKTLSIDPATLCGYAIYTDDKRLDSGIINFSNKKVFHPGDRFIKALTFFQEIICLHQPDCIAYEAVKRWSSSQAALVYGGITAMMQIAAQQNNIPLYGIAPTQAKKFCTGNGRASKEEMIEWANTQFNLVVKDDNEADALAIGYTHIHERANIQEPASELPRATKPVKGKRSGKNIPLTDT